MPFELGQTFTTYAPSVSALAASGGLIKAVYEYMRQNRFRRFEKFQEMSVRFDENDSILKVCGLLLEGSRELANLPKQTKEVFKCFLEEVAMMQNSACIDKHIGSYTFGHYASLAIDSEEFWPMSNLNTRANPRHTIFSVKFLNRN